MKHLKLTAALGLAIAGLFAAGAASADTATSTLQVTATIENYCYMNSPVTNVDLTASGSQSVSTHNTNLQVLCTQGAAWSIDADGGQNYDIPAGDPRIANNNPAWSGAGSRAMLSDTGDSAVTYAIFQDDASTIPFGNVGGNDTPYLGTGTGDWQDVELEYDFSQVMYSPAGDYADQVALTLTY